MMLDITILVAFLALIGVILSAAAWAIIMLWGDIDEKLMEMKHRKDRS